MAMVEFSIPCAIPPQIARVTAYTKFSLVQIPTFALPLSSYTCMPINL